MIQLDGLCCSGFTFGSPLWFHRTTLIVTRHEADRSPPVHAHGSGHGYFLGLSLQARCLRANDPRAVSFDQVAVSNE